MRIRPTAALLALALGVTLAGCGDDAEPSSSGTQTGRQHATKSHNDGPTEETQQGVEPDSTTPTSPSSLASTGSGDVTVPVYFVGSTPQGKRLFRDLKHCGDARRYALVAAYARRVRHAHGLAPWQRRSGQTLPIIAESPYQTLTPCRATWLVLRREEIRNEGEREQFVQLHAHHAEVAAAIDLAQDFAQLMRQRQPEELDPWLVRATTSRP